MNKIIILLFLIGTFSCNKNFDHSRIYDIIQDKFPEDKVIEKSIEKANKPVEYPNFSMFELDFDPLDFLMYKPILNKPLLELHHIYEIQWADKLIAEKVRRRKIYKYEK